MNRDRLSTVVGALLLVSGLAVGLMSLADTATAQAAAASGSSLEQRVKELEKRTSKLEARLSGIRLEFSAAQDGPGYACNQNDKAPADNYFMIGLRDGTGCGVLNINSYRSVKLVVP